MYNLKAAGGKRQRGFFPIPNVPIYIISILLILAISIGSYQHVSLAAPGLAWPAISLTKVTSGVTAPTAIVSAKDGSGRLFVVEQAGLIQIIKNGGLQSIPFLDIRGKVLNQGEEGLLGLAFAPNYNQSGQFFVYYTQSDMSEVLARFQVSSNPDVADPNSELQLMVIPHPVYPNHNGGQLAFGPDGYLYISVGDGGGAGDPNQNAQNLGVLKGKILRIQPPVTIPGSPAPLPTGGHLVYLPLIENLFMAGKNYGVPGSNPFWSNYPAAQPEIWAYGLRNPWKFSFDSQTGDLYIADVGQDTMEEIDFQAAGSAGGQNYGWNIMEGTLCFPSGTTGGCTPPANYVGPVATYTHGTNDSTGCAVIGGYVYRGQLYPSLQGIYLYGDYCSGKIWGLTWQSSSWQTQQLLQTTLGITTFGQGEDGTLYVADTKGGAIYKITAP